VKKTLVSSVLLLCIFSGLAAAEGLIAHWTFDEGTGTTVADSASGYNGTVVGATWAAGKIGGALYFNGTSNYVQVPHNSNLNITGNITIAAWVNFAQGGNGTVGSAQCMVTKCVNNGSTYNPFDFRTTGRTLPSLTMVRASSYGFQGQDSTKTMSINEWHFVAVSVSNRTSTFYVDGVATSKTGNLFPIPAGNTRPLYIGCREDGYFFKGLLDDVRIYNSALDSNEIAELYNEAAAPTEINDHFDDGVLDPAWNITYKNASGWTCSESGTNFTVKGITAPVSYAWNDVSLTREFSAPGDFEIKAKISWDSYRLYSAMQTLYIRAYSGNTIVAESGYCDAWIAARGGKVAKIEPSYNNNNCQMNTLPIAGNVEITIKRENGFAAIFWGSTAILTGYSSSPVDKVELIFSKYVYPGSTFGSLSVDYFTAVAESQKVLQSIGIVGPNSVPEESESQYQVKAYYDDGTNEDITADSNLTVNNDEFAYFDANGLLITERLYRPREKCTISAAYDGLSASLPVTIYAVCNGVQCTNKQIINRNISDTIAIKQDVLEQLKYAKKMETATFQMMAASAKEYKSKNILKARIELLAAITYETWACARIDDSIDNLQDVNSIISK
jgi:hypothetical protein